MPYYVLRIQDIPEDGLSVSASAGTDEWFKNLVKDAVSEDVHSFEATLSAKISKVEKSLEAIGGVYLKLEVDCDRCLKRFEFEQQIPFRLLIEPAPRVKDEPDDEGEDSNEALDFSYYSGNEVDIGDLVRQHIIMAQPINHVCSEDCMGLCPKCGKDLNKEPCGCEPDNTESPFAVLKQLKQ